MKSLKKIFAQKEIKAILGILDEANYRFNNSAFDLVYNVIENAVLSNTEKVIEELRNCNSARHYVYNLIANVSGDYVESGNFHFYRGVLNPMGPGEDLVKIFDTAVDELVKIGALDKDYAKSQKKGLRKNIELAG